MVGRLGRPRSPRSGADSAGPGRAPDVATPCSGRPTTSARGALAQARVRTAPWLLWRTAEPGAHGRGLTGRARRPTGPGGCGRGEPGAKAASREGSAALPPARLAWARRGSARREGARAPRRALLCSALQLLAGSRAEGGPSYPDVRSPGLSCGGGEQAARAAITWETAPSCHQSSGLLLSGGSLGRDGEGAVPPGGAWESQVGAAGAARAQLLGHTHWRPHSRALTHGTLTGAHRHLYMATKAPGIPTPARSFGVT